MPKNHKLTMIKRGTKAYFLEANKIPNFSLFDRLHGYVYARWPYLYIGIGIGEHWLAKVFEFFIDHLNPISKRRAKNYSTIPSESNKSTFVDTYHGKVVPLEAAKQLITIDENITIPDLEQIIPYKRARTLILKNPTQIAVLECPCRSARDHPCLPLDVCLIVGEPFVSFVLDHHPTRVRRITTDEALKILFEEDQRGHVHHAFFKDAMLERFYAICNCCKCCCGAMQAHHNGIPMLASSGYIAQIDQRICAGCGTCVQQCQFSAISKMDTFSVVDIDKCMGCGICINTCKENAISLHRSNEKGEPLEVLQLMNSANLR
jgi:ferredoxin